MKGKKSALAKQQSNEDMGKEKGHSNANATIATANTLHESIMQEVETAKKVKQQAHEDMDIGGDGPNMATIATAISDKGGDEVEGKKSALAKQQSNEDRKRGGTWQGKCNHSHC